jgi:uncharacterized protein
VHYLDASAWVKRYVQESGAAWIAALFAREITFACASLGFIEALATLARKRRAGAVDEMRFGETLRELEGDWEGFTEVSLDGDVRMIAVAVALQHALRGADTVHLASAMSLRRNAAHDEVVIVTSDGDMKAAALAEGSTVLDPVVEEQRESGNSAR